jgi:D-tyrosyl-tRNA(Tyr) deacylase
MIAAIQRVKKASVSIAEQDYGEIDTGLLVLLGIEEADNQADIDWLVNKVANLRVFPDENGVMNLSLIDISGKALVISQFTLHASTRKGNRPSYIKAARPDIAIPLYEKFVRQLTTVLPHPVQTGEFGADMQVSLVNDGPVTIIIDTKNKV